MIAFVLVVGTFVAVLTIWLFKTVVTALVVQEVKGALAERLERDIADAARLIPDDGLREQMHAEWIGELGAAKDRPLTAALMVRGFKVAARQIAADAVPVPAGDGALNDTARLHRRPAGYVTSLAASLRYRYVHETAGNLARVLRLIRAWAAFFLGLAGPLGALLSLVVRVEPVIFVSVVTIGPLASLCIWFARSRRQ